VAKSSTISGMRNWRSTGKRIFREWRSNLIVWLVQWIGGSAVVSAIGRAVWQEVHRSPLDWYFLGAIALIGLVLVLTGAWLQHRHAIATEDRLKEIEAKIPSILINGVPVAGPAKFAANDVALRKERSGLEEEIEKLKEKYLAENLEKTNFQKEMARARNQAEELQAKLSEAMKPPTDLRSRTIALSDELRAFLREYGPEPHIARERGEGDSDYLAQYLSTVVPWKEKMGADFRLRLSASVRRIKDEIQVRCGMSELPLDNAIARAEGRNCEPKFIEEIRDHLWKLAGTIDN
jgi:hypothetical protein